MDDWGTPGGQSPQTPGEQPVKQKRKGKPVRTALGAAVVALLLFLGFDLGLGGGLGRGQGILPVFAPSEQTEQAQPEQSAQPVEATPEQASYSPAEVVVQGDVILYMGEAVSAQTLRERLLESCPAGTEVTLRDDKAIKAVYDSAKGVLDELAYTYREAQ